MQKIADRLRVKSRGVRGEIFDEEEFPGLLKAGINCLITLRAHASTGPAVTPELLNYLKFFACEGITLGDQEFEVMVCEPSFIPIPGRKRNRPPQSFFVLVEKIPSVLHVHRKGILKSLKEM